MRRTCGAWICLPSALAIAGCAASPAAAPGEAGPKAGETEAPAAPASASTPRAAEPEAPAPSATAVASSTAAAPVVERAPPPLSPEEQKDMERRCKPLTDAFARAMRKAARGTELAVLAKVLEHPPPKISQPDASKCGELLERSIRGYIAASIEVEAKTMLHRIALSMASAFERDGKLCPPTERPLPASAAQIAKGPYESTAADWDTPTWKCLGVQLPGQAQRFQYEVRTDPKARAFEIVARGSPMQDGKLIEISQRGTIKPGAGLALEPPGRK